MSPYESQPCTALHEIALLTDGNFPAGRHEARFDASGLPSGIYICQIHAGDFTTAGKMVKVSEKEFAGTGRCAALLLGAWQFSTVVKLFFADVKKYLDYFLQNS
jgi:hypothetical protein